MLFFCKTVRLVDNMLTGILRVIAKSYANSTYEKDLICSFFFIYDEEVTMIKRKYVLEWDILQQLRQVYSLVFASSCSSEMSISSSLAALMALSFSPPLMRIVCFCYTGFYPFPL